VTSQQIKAFNASATETVVLLQLITKHAAEAAAALNKLAEAQQKIITSI